MTRLLCSGILLLILPNAVYAQGYAPDVAAQKMVAADGLSLKLFASEPEVRQPILVKCDDRGRLWTIQYLQYPNPAGLKRVKVDRWSRTVYDRVPKPPPHGPPGADKITILEDTNGDGRADSQQDFVDGLNLCTGLAFGHGGVFVLQVPYLLFYPDRNRDDAPDSDPDVLLTGFGMEDAQSLANHLTWGPDGWLYGVNGSTTTCRVRGIEFQQGCWRYHPLTKDFELFCEGGGNTFGLTFDENGHLFYSTNGGPFVHAVQGGYFYKSFGKHGPLHNLYAYGHFGPLKRDNVPGGPPTGGTIYLGNTLPNRFRGKFIAGNFLGHTMSWWDVSSLGTTVEAHYGGVLLDSGDSWFGVTDVCTGPDGSLFVADFHDQRTSHPDPDARWDRSNGRIYKISADSETKTHEVPRDLRSLSSEQLVDLLNHKNRWFADRARVLLAERCDQSVLPRLSQLALQTDDNSLALQGLWALQVSGGMTDEIALQLLGHPYQYVRSWTVRLLGDRKQVSRQVAARLTGLAASDDSPTVRSQLAASAKRLPCEVGLPIVTTLLDRNLDENDPRIPWLIWWAVESWSVSDLDRIVDMFATPELWNSPSYRGNLRRLVRRYAAEGTAVAYSACLKLLQATPAEHLKSAHQALAQGLAERTNDLHGIGFGGLYQQFAATDDPGAAPRRREFAPLSGDLKSYIQEHWEAKPADVFWMRLAIRADVRSAYGQVLERLADPNSNSDVRKDMLDILSSFGRKDCVPIVLDQLNAESPEGVQAAALDAVSRFDSQAIADRLIGLYPQFSAKLRSRARDVLLSRPDSTRAFLNLVEQEQVDPTEVSLDQLRRVALHRDREMNAIVIRFWGRIGSGTPEEKLATMRRFNNDLRPGGGDLTRGRVLFRKHCATCHTLFGEGLKIGPDLTTANRKDRAALLAAIVDPSAVIRREYLSYVAVTNSGQVITGLLAEQDGAQITLLDAKNRRIKISRDDVESFSESPVSLMPDRQLEELTPQQIRDLFSYLQK